MEFLPIKSKSGNIQEAAYDGESKVQVRFKNGGLYENTKPIAPDDWKGFERTFPSEDSSTGSYFHQHLKKFDFKKI